MLKGSTGATSERGKGSGEGLPAGPPNGRPVPEVAGMSMGTRYRKVQLTGTVGLRADPAAMSAANKREIRGAKIPGGNFSSADVESGAEGDLSCDGSCQCASALAVNCLGARPLPT